MRNVEINFEMRDAKQRSAEYEFSVGFRVTHWIRALCIVFLVVSGFYLAYVFISPSVSDEPVGFLNAFWRMSHQIVGFVLIACMMFKSYLFLFDKQSKSERDSFFDSINPKTFVRQILFYLHLGEHPNLKGSYNPLQFFAYIFFYIVLALICLTGLILYTHVYHDGFSGFIAPLMRIFESWMGGLASVRILHHIAMWAIIIFVFVHVYMVIYNAVRGKDGALDAVVSGYKYTKDGKRT